MTDAPLTSVLSFSSALWSSTEAAKATGGTASGQWVATGFSIDTRSLKKAETTQLARVLSVAAQLAAVGGQRCCTDAIVDNVLRRFLSKGGRIDGRCH